MSLVVFSFILYHYYHICIIITITRSCVYGGEVHGGRLIDAVDAGHHYGGLEEGPLKQDVVPLSFWYVVYTTRFLATMGILMS